MESEVQDALEVAAGSRIKSGSGIGGHTTPSHHDMAITRKTILLFLESLDPEMTVGELRHHLDQ